MPPIRLRPPTLADADILCQDQFDPEATRMAVINPRDADEFRSAWERNLTDLAVTIRIILDGDTIVGQVCCFKLEGLDSVGYWITRPHWNRGIATRALALLLQEVTTRPLYARSARSNTASHRVLEKCGFTLHSYVHTPETPRFPACERALFILT